jgi:hypothetical protein
MQEQTLGPKRGGWRVFHDSPLTMLDLSTEF